MKKNNKNIRDEQKGFIFIGLILVVVIVLSVIFKFALKTNIVKDNMEENAIVKTLFVVEDTDNSILYSSVLFNHSSSYKSAILNIPGYTGSIYKTIGRVDRIDKVYEEAGIAGFKNEVEKMLGIDIPFYTIIKLEDFTKFCDYLGGLRVFIAEPVDCTTVGGQRWLLPSGAVTLDGDKIATYLNYRTEDETEFDVQERYQSCMAAFIAGIHEKKFQIFDKNNFDVYANSIISNISDEEEKTLFQLIAEADAESIIKQTITGSVRNVDDQQLLFPDNNGEFIKEAVGQTINMLTSADGNLSSRVYVLEIQNGTTIQGLARNTAVLFQKASYDVLSPVNASRNDYEETIIIDHIGNPEIAKLVGEFIHCDNIREITDEEEVEGFYSEANVDFTIILGKDFNGRYVIPR